MTQTHDADTGVRARLVGGSRRVLGLDPQLLRERFARCTDTFGIEIESAAAVR
jgi:hypothetical protein